jgi:hypothetical protein
MDTGTFENAGLESTFHNLCSKNRQKPLDFLTGQINQVISAEKGRYSIDAYEAWQREKWGISQKKGNCFRSMQYDIFDYDAFDYDVLVHVLLLTV